MRHTATSLTVLLLSGCGTICTAVEDGKGCAKLAPYSGTRASAQGHATQWDVPLSLLGDTLLLPITIPKMLFGSSADEDAKNSAPPQPKPNRASTID